MLTQETIDQQHKVIQAALKKFSVNHNKACPHRKDQQKKCTCGANTANLPLNAAKSMLSNLIRTMSSDEYIMDRACVLMFGENNCNCED